MSRQALSASALISQDKLRQLGLLYGIDSPEQQFPVVNVLIGKPLPRTIREAVADGANFEDSGKRVAHHFFNPLTNGKLTAAILPPLNDTSPDWALEDNGTISVYHFAAPQKYSYRLAQDYLLNALTQPSNIERDKNWGLVFQTLGQVIHHIQDMAQPQHVRNDIRIDLNEWGLPNIQGISNPSTYEGWILRTQESGLPPYAAYAPVYSLNDLDRFAKPRHFWTSSSASIGSGGVGMAEFTNRNFFSQGTLAPNGDFPAPVGTFDEIADIETLCAAVRTPCPPGVSGHMLFTHTTVTDNLRPSSFDNPMGAARSLYSWDLEQKQRTPLYTLNRFTYDKAAEFLIPRAIGYSAGLLNFFFRGQMTITVPDQGFYAVVDHTTPAGSDKFTGGFSTIKLKVQNTTPGPNNTIEPMATDGTGKLYAVVKFHRNTCYQADLSGEYGSPNVDWNLCRANDEEIVVSTPVQAPTNINTAPAELTFAFPTPIPISGTDMFLQVVYDGKLGQEPRAIVVATKDISEPTYLTGWDVHDEFMYAHYPYLEINGGGVIYTWSEWCQQAIDAGDVTSQAQCNTRLWPTKVAYQFSPTAAPIPGWDPANPTVPLGDWSDISIEPLLNPAFVLSYPTGTYARAAVLTDADPTNAVIAVTDWDGTKHIFAWVGGTLIGAKNQKDLATNTLTPTQTWAPARGIYVAPTDAQVIGNPTNVGRLQPTPLIFPPSP